MFSFTRKPGVFLLFGQGALRNPHFLFHLDSIPNAVMAFHVKFYSETVS